MTRALLEQAIAALEGVLDAPVGVAAEFWSCAGGVYEAVECNNAINALQAELAKPAPTQPAWHDQPTQPGLSLHRYLGYHEMWRIYDLADSQGVRGRFFGPLPEDTK